MGVRVLARAFGGNQAIQCRLIHQIEAQHPTKNETSIIYKIIKQDIAWVPGNFFVVELHFFASLKIPLTNSRRVMSATGSSSVATTVVMVDNSDDSDSVDLDFCVDRLEFYKGTLAIYLDAIQICIQKEKELKERCERLCKEQVDLERNW